MGKKIFFFFIAKEFILINGIEFLSVVFVSFLQRVLDINVEMRFQMARVVS